MLITGNVLAQNQGGNSQGQQISALQVAVSNLQAAVSNLQATVKALTTSNNDLSNRLQYVSVVGTDVYITGANLNIVNGSG
jgi:hypothetical protein